MARGGRGGRGRNKSRTPARNDRAPQRNTANARALPEAQFPQVVASVGVTKLHQGPLPDADSLAAYERVQTGLAERIVRMAEKPLEMAQEQQTHRIALETKVVRSDIRRSWAGLIVGGVIVAGVIIAGIVLTVQGRTTAGLASILTPLGGLVGVFVYTDQRKRRERREALSRTLTG